MGALPKPLQTGDPITAKWLNEVIDAMFERIVPGDGILIKKVGPGRWIIMLADDEIIPV